MTTDMALSADGSVPGMKELNEELWKLGVTAGARHNEVAPA